MTVVYILDTNQYDPISYGTNYLYNQFDRIESFLLKQNPNLFKDILAKPILRNNQVLWYANFQGPFARITDLEESVQTAIKTRYWEVRAYVDQEIKQLSLSRDKEKSNWANLLKEVFNEDDNVIISVGKDWCLLWGWKFRNTTENYLPPEFRPKSLSAEPIKEATSHAESSGFSENVPTNDFGKPATYRIPVITDNPPVFGPVRPGLWDRIKRVLRTFVYRMWGLLLLIMLILFIACLIKKCSNDKVSESCKDMEVINKKLIDLDKKVEDRCEVTNQ